ncbi:MmcQ/YjbR family DNA-binding protein [Granulicella sp. WH15]|nr:MmcQ/YjbR family DNA-binding protein [Granulicella sp. WH15]
MNVETTRAFLLSLPHVVETRQWGGALVYWVGDKAIGGKMCAILNPDAISGGEESVFRLVTYPTTPEHFAELVEIEGIRPAKYLARVSWVSVHRWDVFRTSEWQQELRAAHALKLAKLPPKTQKVLALPKADQKRIIAEQRKLLAAREAQKAAAKGASESRARRRTGPGS